MGYEIKVLESNEFDKVAKSDPRYSFVDDTNMGFSDRQKGIAYVRHSHINDLNKYLINHELEELVDEHSDHEDANGIRHKKFFKEFLEPLFTGFNGETGKFSPAGILDNSISKGAQDAQKSQENLTVNGGAQGFDMSQFGNMGGAMGGFGTVTGKGGGASASPQVSDTVTGGIQSGMNNGINNEVLQKLKAGNYSQSGQQAGRFTF